jgi:hypothetical protein
MPKTYRAKAGRTRAGHPFPAILLGSRIDGHLVDVTLVWY